MRILTALLADTLRFLAEFVVWFWQTGLFQSTAQQLLMLLRHVMLWFAAHPGGIAGGIVAGWLARLFASVSTTRMLMEFALGDLGMPLFYTVIVGVGVLVGAGIIELRRPYDG